MSGKQILAFEADPLYANMLTETLGNNGFQVDVVSDVVEKDEEDKQNLPNAVGNRGAGQASLGHTLAESDQEHHRHDEAQNLPCKQEQPGCQADNQL